MRFVIVMHAYFIRIRCLDDDSSYILFMVETEPTMWITLGRSDTVLDKTTCFLISKVFLTIGVRVCCSLTGSSVRLVMALWVSTRKRGRRGIVVRLRPSPRMTHPSQFT